MDKRKNVSSLWTQSLMFFGFLFAYYINGERGWVLYNSQFKLSPKREKKCYGWNLAFSRILTHTQMKEIVLYL